MPLLVPNLHIFLCGGKLSIRLATHCNVKYTHRLRSRFASSLSILIPSRLKDDLSSFSSTRPAKRDKCDSLSLTKYHNRQHINKRNESYSHPFQHVQLVNDQCRMPTAWKRAGFVHDTNLNQQYLLRYSVTIKQKLHTEHVMHVKLWTTHISKHILWIQLTVNCSSPT